MKMGKAWVSGLGITGIVLLALIVCASLRMFNAILYKLGGVGVLVAILVLAYAVIRRRD